MHAIAIIATLNTINNRVSSEHMMLGLLALIVLISLWEVLTSTLITGPLNHLWADTNHQISTIDILDPVSTEQHKHEDRKRTARRKRR